MTVFFFRMTIIFKHFIVAWRYFYSYFRLLVYKRNFGLASFSTAILDFLFITKMLHFCNQLIVIISDLSEINLHNQEMCSSCDENHVGVFKCVECDDILCQRCYKAHGRLKVTKTHVVTPL